MISKTNEQFEAKKNARQWRMLLGIAAALIFVFVCIAGMYYFYTSAMEKNPAFEIRRENVKVSADDPWSFDGSLRVAGVSLHTDVWELIVRASEEGKRMIEDARMPASRRIGETVDKVNFFSVDWAQVRENIAKKPDVGSASMRLLLPDAVEIKIFSRVPVGYVKLKDVLYVCDDQCMIMERLSTEPSRKMPIIRAPETANYRLGQTAPGLMAPITLLNQLSPDDGLAIELIKIRPSVYETKILIYCTYKPYSETRKIVAVFSDKDIERRMRRFKEKLRADYYNSQIERDNYLDLTLEHQIVSSRKSLEEVQKLFSDSDS